jgi:hypothetical protein
LQLFQILLHFCLQRPFGVGLYEDVDQNFKVVLFLVTHVEAIVQGIEVHLAFFPTASVVSGS